MILNKDKKLKVQESLIEKLKEKNHELIVENESLKQQLEFEKNKSNDSYIRANQMIEDLEKKHNEYDLLINSLKELKTKYNQEVLEISDLKKKYQKEMAFVIKGIKKDVKNKL